MRKLVAALFISLGLASAALAQSSTFQVITAKTAVIDVSTATTTKLVTASNVTNFRTYITTLSVDVGGADVVTFEYGTGTNCGTGTTALTGPYTLTSGVPLHVGNGGAPVLIIPTGNDFCVVTSAAVSAAGFIGYTQF